MTDASPIKFGVRPQITEIAEDRVVRPSDDRRTFMLRQDVDLTLSLDGQYPDGFSFGVVNDSRNGNINVVSKQGDVLHIGGVRLGESGQAVRAGALATHFWRKAGSLWFAAGGYSTNMSFERRTASDGRAAAG